jgi:hypothetical protein
MLYEWPLQSGPSEPTTIASSGSSAFRGQTPDELYFATGADVPDRLGAARDVARAKRVAANRAARCGVCA